MRFPRPLSPRRQALLNETARAADRAAEAAQLLEYELEASDVARHAAAAELLRLRALLECARRHLRRLPPPLAERVAACVQAQNQHRLAALTRDEREPFA